MADEQVASQAAPEQLPSGMVPFTDVLSGSTPSPMARGGEGTFLSRAYGAVASPVTAAVRAPFDLAGKLDVASGIKSPETASSRADAYSKFLVPQTPVDAAITGASMGAGRFVRPASKLLGGALRAGIDTAVGAGTGALSDEGALSGSIKGLTAGALTEGVTGLVNRLRKTGVERVVAKQQAQDANDVGQLIDELPQLKGVFTGQRTPEQLYDLTHGAGKTLKGQEVGQGVAKLKDAQDAAEGQITGLLGPQAAAPKFPDAMTPGKFVGWDEARRSLSELGDMARKMKPQATTTIDGKSYNGGEVKQLYAEQQRLFQSQLNTLEPTGQAVKLFNDSRAQYAAGLKTLDMLKKAFNTSDPERIVFNTANVANWLRKQQSPFAKTFGDEGLQKINDVIYRGERPGLVDRYTPSGLLSGVSGAMPLPGPAGYIREGLGSMLGTPRLVGDPRAMGQGAEQGLRFLGAQSANAAGQLFDPNNPTAALNGIPGLK